MEQLREWENCGITTPELVLIGRRLPGQHNSLLADSGVGQGQGPLLMMSPADATKRGLRDGDHVLVTSHAGSTEADLLVTDAIRDGTASLPHGWTNPSANSLTSDSVDIEPSTGMPRLVHFGITVVAVDRESRGTVDVFPPSV